MAHLTWAAGFPATLPRGKINFVYRSLPCRACRHRQAPTWSRDTNMAAQHPGGEPVMTSWAATLQRCMVACFFVVSSEKLIGEYPLKWKSSIDSMLSCISIE